MVVQIGNTYWINPEDVVAVTEDGNGFAIVYVRGMGSELPGIGTGWPVEVVVRSINAGGE